MALNTRRMSMGANTEGDPLEALVFHWDSTVNTRRISMGGNTEGYHLEALYKCFFCQSILHLINAFSPTQLLLRQCAATMPCINPFPIKCKNSLDLFR